MPAATDWHRAVSAWRSVAAGNTWRESCSNTARTGKTTILGFVRENSLEGAAGIGYSTPDLHIPTSKNERQSYMTLPIVTAFVSYSHKDREYGGQAKSVLREVGIDAFLAHDDLAVSEEWQRRILKELSRCDLFVPLLSKNFLDSKWAPQEAGFIASRPKVVIAPLSIDETTPYGFFSHVQSSRITGKGITRELLVEPLAKKFPRKILPELIQIAGDAGSFRYAERTEVVLLRWTVQGHN